MTSRVMAPNLDIVLCTSPSLQTTHEHVNSRSVESRTKRPRHTDAQEKSPINSTKYSDRIPDRNLSFQERAGLAPLVKI